MKNAHPQKSTESRDWVARFQALAEEAKHPLLKRFYQAGIVDAETPLEHVEMLAMDVETTGLNAQAHGIVSIGLLPFTLKRIRCGEAFYWLINPPSELRGESVTFHHITHSDILHAPQLPDVLEALLGAMAGKVIVVHYRSIERGFLDQSLRRHTGEG